MAWKNLTLTLIYYIKVTLKKTDLNYNFNTLKDQDQDLKLLTQIIDIQVYGSKMFDFDLSQGQISKSGQNHNLNSFKDQDLKLGT